MNKKELILDELINMGLSAADIQSTYERYKWHLGYYPKRLKQLEESNKLLKKHNDILFNCIKEQIINFEKTPLFEDGTHRLIVKADILESLKETLIKSGYKF